ncbi:incFII family plasmid replication initiator RepA [Pantoea sp. Mhis]|uniref:incFII family plasmid replication initiator RepA n=1 Tax=Pantoea sp. Mhis TaxID=2576759 RepID=UPI001F45CA1E|nr:incFII family plasmid replication initiator RepA [Pantoea sp. Mhis]
MTNTHTRFKLYKQVNNPNPEFIPRKGIKTLPFCRKLMSKAINFTTSLTFAIHVAFARSLGKRRRMPPLLRRRAIDALLQGICFHYDPLANRVQCSITNLAIECGLATESKNGNLSTTRATRALRFLKELGLITYYTEYDPQIGCNIPTDITFTPALFRALNISEIAVTAARKSRMEWENQQRKNQNLSLLSMNELIERSWNFIRDRFRTYHAKAKLHGLKRARGRRDAYRSSRDIENMVKCQLTREIAEGRFKGTQEAAFSEVKRRVRERMLISRKNNYTRLHNLIVS